MIVSCCLVVAGVDQSKVEQATMLMGIKNFDSFNVPKFGHVQLRVNAEKGDRY